MQNVIAISAAVNQKNEELIRNPEAGITMLEFVGYMALGLTIIAGSAYLVAGGSANVKVAELQQGLSFIRMNVQQMYTGSTDFDGLNNTTAIAAGAIPGKMIDDAAAGDISSPWGDAITIKGSGKTFTVEIATLPQDACIKMSQYQSYAWEDIEVGDDSTLDLSVQAAAALCTDDEPSVTFTAR